jgi:drug/metabolite transporter (DMT)-like permease
LLGVGLFTQLGQLGLTQALTALPAAQATAISYVQVLLAGLWGWLIFGETSDASTIAGGLLVLAATLISLSRPAQPSPAQPRNGNG